jgi:TolB-like protein
VADIFISYARGDRERAAQLAAALEGAGYSVWWDRHIVGGAEFSADIERELKAAKAVIVAWSQEAIVSHWVKDEATLARDAGKLVPVSLDGTDAPMGFRQFQTIAFAGWKGEAEGAPVAALRDSICQKTGARVAPVVLAPSAKPGFRATPKQLLAGAAFVALLALGIVSLFVWRPGQHPSGTAAGPGAPPAAKTASTILGDKSIAVLPFTNMSPDKENEYFADGLTEELLNRLANIGDLKVTSRTSSFAFKGKNTPLPEIAKQLGVRHILEGSVRRDGDELRVTAQLIDVATDTHLWSETYDRKIEKIFALQDEIAARVTEALKVALLGADDRPLAPLPETSVELYADYMKARQELATFKFEPMKEAEASLTRVVGADPKFVPAATTLIELYLGMGETGIISMPDAIDRAQPLVDRVLLLSDRNAEAWLARGQILAIENNPVAAEKARARAYALAPNNPLILRDQITRDYWTRKPGRAAPLIDRLIALDPLWMYSYVPPLFWYSRRGDVAQFRALAHRLAELLPGNPFSHFFPFVSPAPEDNTASTIREGRLGYELEPTDPDGPAFLALFLMDAGEPGEAERLIREARALDAQHGFAAVVDALYRTYRGDDAGALKIAETLAQPKASARWGSREIALRMLATPALARNDSSTSRRLITLYLSAYPELERGDLTSRFTFPALYVKWAHLMAALDLAALFEKVGDSAESRMLLGAVEAELNFWPLRGVFGTGFAEAELHAARGEDKAALASLRKAEGDGLTYAWWWFLDHSPHFAHLRGAPEFAEIRASFAARAASPSGSRPAPAAPRP